MTPRADDRRRLPQPARWAAALLCALLAAAPAHAEGTSPEMRFLRLGADAGLSQGAVMALAQDSTGFLWLGTEDGLNRYDGEELRHYVRDRGDPASLPRNYVSTLATDAADRLWIGTDGGGIAVRLPGANGFSVPADATGKPLVDPTAKVRVVQPDSRGTLWVGTRGAGLWQIDPAARTARSFRGGAAGGTLSDDSINAVHAAADGIAWVGTVRGLDRLDPASGQVRRYGARLEQLLGRPAGSGVPVTALSADRRGALWIGTAYGLVRLDAATDRLEALRHSPGNPASLPDDRVNAILEDDELRLWVGTSGGLALLDRRSGRFTTFRHDPADLASLPDSNVIALAQDRGGLLWIGTKVGGAARWNPRSWSFGLRRLGDPGADNVSAFAEDRRGRLWLGSFGAGLSMMDRRSGEIRRWTHDHLQGASIGDNFVMALVIDDRDRLWLGTMRAGVERLDPATGAITRFKAGPGGLAAPGIMSLLRDSRGNVWAGTYGGGLCRIDGSSDAVRCFPVAKDGGAGLSSDRATTLAEDPAGLIWIGTDGGGLNVLDPATGRFAHFRHAPQDPRSLSADTIYSVHVDARGQVWVGTRGGGLDRVQGAPFAAETLHFQNYSELQGLPNSTVYGIESDSAGQLWLSTNRGLARFDPATGRVQAFRRNHGLQGDEFNFGAHYRSPSGELFFGGPAGFNGFRPERLRFNDRPPPVVLTSFLKFNDPAALPAPVEQLQDIALDYRDDVVTFRYAALDYASPGDNRYAYMLEGFDADWVDAGNRRQATYTNLAGGDYVFRVKATNGDGLWNDTGVALRISVDNPPWLQWWAYALYAAAFLCVMGTIWLAQQRKLEREAAYARRLESEVADRTAEIAERNHELQAVNSRLREASVTDPLTGLSNRRGLREVVAELLGPDPAAPRATAHRFVLMIVDLDHLKPINDQYGHEGGDAVLIGIAGILRQMCRSTDRVVRWGGDEFVVLCDGTDFDGAALLAERIRASVAKQIFRLATGTVARSSCSIGFAPYPFIPGTPDKLGWEQSLALADAALYQAKRQRNHWVGFAGTAAAAELTSPKEAIEADPSAMEAEGRIEVRRRPPLPDDGDDRLRVVASATDR